jgi:hypothetical protein
MTNAALLIIIACASFSPTFRAELLDMLRELWEALRGRLEEQP